MKVFRQTVGRDDKHHFWKGDKVSYRTLHNWIERHRGKAIKCENKNCGGIAGFTCCSGSSCIYEEVDGYGRCFNYHGNDHVPPTIEITQITEGYTYTYALMGFFNGVEIEPKLYPNKVIQFRIEASEEVQCKISFLPLINFTSVIWPSSKFDTTHDFSYQMPNLNLFKNYLVDILGLLALVELGKIDEISNHIQIFLYPEFLFSQLTHQSLRRVNRFSLFQFFSF
ncbi:MAG: hypothetical protein IH948_01105 [Bacteroidetes bacterium]|nr:hypothetical protein [Bacteroidota bacterium]